MKLRLGQNSFSLFAARLGTLGLMVIFTALLARRLGVAGFGEYAVLAATIFVGNTLTTFGTDMLLVREIAARGQLVHLPAALLLQLVLSVLFVALVAVASPFLPGLNPPAVLALRLYSLSMLPLAFYTVFTSALRGMERMGSYALLGLAGVVLQLLGVVSLPALNLLNLALWLLAVQCLLALLAGLLCALQIPAFGQAWNFRGAALPALTRASAPVALLAVLGMLYQKMNIYLLSALAGAAPTAWFAGAARAVEASKSAHISVFTALFPSMARAGPGSAGHFRLARAALLGAALLISLAVSLLAAPLVILLFGPGFAPAVPVLRVLAWMMPPYTLNTYLTLACLAEKKEARVAVALGASLLALVVLNLFWVPSLGASGAAWAALSAECVQALALLAGRGFVLEIDPPGGLHEFSQPS